jgi:hypothetical protein
MKTKDLRIESYVFAAQYPKRTQVALMAKNWLDSTRHVMVLRPGKPDLRMVRPRDARGRFAPGWRACFEIIENGRAYIDSQYLTIESHLHDIRLAVW